MRRKILSLLFAFYFFASSAVFAAVATVICLATAALDPSRRLLHRFAGLWGYHYILMNPGWHCCFEGEENISRDRACIFVANHQSYWDIMVLYGLKADFKWVSKEEILKMPFIGWNLWLNECVCFARNELKSIKKMFADCKKWLRKDTSIMIFPEGTRSADGQLQEFKEGPFRLAIDCNVPIVPIVVDGTYDVFPKGASSINFCSQIKVRILPPMYPGEFDGSAKKLRAAVFEQMQKCLQRLRDSS